MVSPEDGKAYYATLTRADDPLVEGTALNKAKMDELLAATGTTTGTAATLKLAQSGFVLRDGATIRFKLHVAVNTDTVTLNVAGTGAKPLKGLDGEYINAAAGAELQAVYNGSAWMCTALGAKAVGQIKGPDGALVKPSYTIRAVFDPLTAVADNFGSRLFASHRGYYIYEANDPDSESYRYYLMDFVRQKIQPLPYSVFDPGFKDYLVFFADDYLCVYRQQNNTIRLFRVVDGEIRTIKVDITSIAALVPELVFVRNGVFYLKSRTDDGFYDPACMLKLTKTGVCTGIEFKVKISGCIGHFGDNYYFSVVDWGGNPNLYACYNAATNTMSQESYDMFSPKGDFNWGDFTFGKYSFGVGWWDNVCTLTRFDYEHKQIITQDLTHYGDAKYQSDRAVLGAYSDAGQNLIVVACPPHLVYIDPVSFGIVRAERIGRNAASILTRGAKANGMDDDLPHSLGYIFGGRYLCAYLVGEARIFDLKEARFIANLGTSQGAQYFSYRRNGYRLDDPLFFTYQGNQYERNIQAFRIAQMPVIPWTP